MALHPCITRPADERPRPGLGLAAGTGCTASSAAMFGAPVGMSIHLFADGVDPEPIRHASQQWLNTALV